MSAITSLLGLRPDQIAKAGWFEFSELVESGLDLRIYEEPRPDHNYSLGCDFALGMEGRDYDTGLLLDRDTDPIREVASFGGHLGEEADKVIYALCRYYKRQVFIVGERQCGLAVLRSLLKDYGYGWLYYDRREEVATRPITDKLGYHKHKGVHDLAMRASRLAIKQRECIVRTPILIDQLGNLQFQPKTTIEPEDALDVDMKLKLAGGGSPDYERAFSYAWWGISQMAFFARPKVKYDEGTYGDILKMADDFPPPQPIRRGRRSVVVSAPPKRKLR